jgi:hypothetical protein
MTFKDILIGLLFFMTGAMQADAKRDDDWKAVCIIICGGAFLIACTRHFL